MPISIQCPLPSGVALRLRRPLSQRRGSRRGRTGWPFSILRGESSSVRRGASTCRRRRPSTTRSRLDLVSSLELEPELFWSQGILSGQILLGHRSGESMASTSYSTVYLACIIVLRL
ncbi:hypothetical protein E2562_030233 [Oryza meyeriana var. granulata]|uniref:Uncharacterized protein n=1 Tax=Oryza meyeriana var. granulata TaxID=110450 RepID=A0A6G1D936_9ORYZ|nr:hypothetical protein E2562_030233 [Oryza meyeriana var. granulata]